MKKDYKKNCIWPYVVFCLIAAAFLGSVIYTGINAHIAPAKAKPTIVVEEINMTPYAFFVQNEDIMMPAESEIYRKYSVVPKGERGNKWTTKYKYVYLIQYNSKKQRRAAAEFSRVSYLESHPNDAVDKKLIFSDQAPDSKIFEIHIIHIQ